MKLIRTISRLLLGVIFVYSGIVKGVDPMGTMFKIEDYFIAYGTEWAMPAALFLSVLLCTFEFLLGISLLFNARVKQTFPFLVLMMAFFTIMTFFDAIYNPVPDCGCFGEALILTNWQTFWKNVVIMGIILLMYLARKKAAPPLRLPAQNAILIIGSALFIAFSVYNYYHLPMLDFREWKIGKSMYPEKELPVKYYLTYTHKKTGEQKEYLSPDYPYNDSTWLANWEFTSQRTEDPNLANKHELQLIDEYGQDVTDSYIRNPEYQFLIISWDLDDVNEKIWPLLNQLNKEAHELQAHTALLTPALKSEIDAFREKSSATYDILNADDIELKTMVRSRPGIMLLKDGIVINKWNWRDFPGAGIAIEEHEKHHN